jgi:eukaryotic-like serine/threonine-protein kinase
VSLPESIGRYRVLALLGQGAMGVVYRGRDDTLDRDVALKVMSRGHVADGEARERFLREARAAARLQHPNIVTIYELGEHAGSPFMAMELLEGTDLQRAIEGGLRPDPRRTLPIVLQLLAGLAHAHDNGIVHRDVKPSNMFLPRKRPAKILDFGVARLAGGGTTAGTVVGTPNYMSPEQVRGHPLDGRSDLFSAGLILYELVTGEKAYKADSVVALLYAIAHEPANLALIPQGPSWERLRGVLAASLSHDLERRYADARGMSRELEAGLLDLGGTADWAAACNWGVVSRRAPSSAPAPPAAPLDTPAAPAVGTARSSPRGPLLAAAGLGVAAALLMSVALLTLRRAPASSAPAGIADPAAAVAPAPLPTAAARPMPGHGPTPAPAAPSVAAVARAAPASRPLEPEAASEPASTQRASRLLEEGRYGAALAEARAVLQRDPGDEEAKTVAEEAEAALVIEAALGKARAALREGDKDGAIEHLKIGLAVNSNERRLLELWRQATQ